MDWIEHDGVAEADLPEWARAAGEPLDGGAVRLLGAGVVFEEGGRFSAVPWEAILTTATTDDALLVCVPRRPPAPPWFAVGGAAGPAIEAARARRALARRGYRREPGRARPTLSPEETLRRVLANADIPGAVEVPIGIPRPRPWSHVLGGSVVGVLFGVQFLSSGLAVAGAVALGAATAVIGGFHWGAVRSYRRRPRVLVMTPDAFVAGLDGRTVRALPWEGIGEIRIGAIGDAPAIEVIDPEGRPIARVEGRFFGVDPSVVVGIARAYGDRLRPERPGRQGS